MTPCSKKKDEVLQSNKLLKQENESLQKKKKKDMLKLLADKLTYSSNKLELILNNERAIYNSCY